MTRSKKEPVIKYGIEITKPHSQEMYEHNQMVAEEMKKNILSAWKALLDKQTLHDEDSLMECSWEYITDDSDLAKLQKLVCYSGYGSGYTVGDVNEEFLKELDIMANWQLHQEYDYGVDHNLVPKTKFGMLGHGGEKYSDIDTCEFSPACYESIPHKK